MGRRRSFVSGTLFVLIWGCAASQPGSEQPGSPESEPVSSPAAVADQTPAHRDGPLCAHIFEVLERAAAQPATAEQRQTFMSECQRGAETERLKIGDAQFEQQASCIMTARDKRGLETCDPDARGSRAGDLELCEHVIRIFKNELAGTGPAVEADISGALESCMTDIVDERERLGQEAFDRQARCILEADDVEELMGCEEPSPPSPP